MRGNCVSYILTDLKKFLSFFFTIKVVFSLYYDRINSTVISAL